RRVLFRSKRAQPPNRMAQDKHRPRSRVGDGGDVLKFLRQAIVATRFTLTVTAAIHRTRSKVCSKQREEGRPPAAITCTSMDNQETRAVANAFNSDTYSVL